MFSTKLKKKNNKINNNNRNAPISKLSNKLIIIVMSWTINNKYNINIISHNIIGGMKYIFLISQYAKY